MWFKSQYNSIDHRTEMFHKAQEQLIRLLNFQQATQGTNIQSKMQLFLSSQYQVRDIILKSKSYLDSLKILYGPAMLPSLVIKKIQDLTIVCSPIPQFYQLLKWCIYLNSRGLFYISTDLIKYKISMMLNHRLDCRKYCPVAIKLWYTNTTQMLHCYD